MAVLKGFEPSTLALTRRRSNRWSYKTKALGIIVLVRVALMPLARATILRRTTYYLSITGLEVKRFGNKYFLGGYYFRKIVGIRRLFRSLGSVLRLTCVLGTITMRLR